MGRKQDSSDHTGGVEPEGSAFTLSLRPELEGSLWESSRHDGCVYSANTKTHAAV